MTDLDGNSAEGMPSMVDRVCYAFFTQCFRLVLVSPDARCRLGQSGFGRDDDAMRQVECVLVHLQPTGLRTTPHERKPMFQVSK